MEKQTPDNNMAKGMTRTLTFNVYPQDSLKLTVLFNIVIGIIVSTPGGYLESPMKTLSAFSTASTPLPSNDVNKRRKDSPGWLWGCWTKGRVRWHDASGPQYISHPASTQQNTLDKSHHRYSPAGGYRQTHRDNDVCPPASYTENKLCQDTGIISHYYPTIIHIYILYKTLVQR